MTDGKQEQTAAAAATSISGWDSLELARRIAGYADDKKALDVVILDVEEALQVTDYFVIATGRNRRHLGVVAESAAKELKQHGIHRLQGTPFNDENWVVLDFGDVVLHVFSAAARDFYDLENLWGDCEAVEWTPSEAEEEPAA